jgi:argininosuccinate lyase
MTERNARPLWHGRFGEEPADELLAFTSSLAFDRRLAQDDIAGSRAHVAMLARVGLLPDGEAAALTTALDAVENELAEGTFAFVSTDEDIHTAIERRVIDLAGPAGAKLHTGRSRNDQVALDLRLFLRREGKAVTAAVHALQEVLVRRATDASSGRRPSCWPTICSRTSGRSRATSTAGTPRSNAPT